MVRGQLDLLTERVGRSGVLALALLALWVVITLPGLGHKYAYEWDSAQFAFGAERWSLPDHQPHPFGFPFWILMLKAVKPLMSPLLAQRVLSFLFTIAGLAVLWRLLREVLDARAAWVATALVAWAPPVRMLAVAQTTYTVDFFGGGLAGWFAIRAWRGHAASAFWLPVTVALLGGFRSSTLSFLVPLTMLTLLAFVLQTRRWGVAWAGCAVGGAITAAWVAAVVSNAGGFSVLQDLSQQTFGNSLKYTSMLNGAPWSGTQRTIELSAAWIFLALIGLVVPLGVWILLLRMWGDRHGAHQRPIPTPLNLPFFYAAWAGPTLFAIFLIHGPKPGYQMLVLPALALAVSILVFRIANRLAGDKDWHLMTTLVAGILAAVAVTWLPCGKLLPRHQYWFETFRAMPAIHSEIDESMEALLRLIDEHGPRSIVLMHRSTFEGPNSRVLEYHKRDVALAEFIWEDVDLAEGLNLVRQGKRVRVETIPEQFTEALIVLHGYDPDLELRSQFPLMRRVYKRDFMQVWASPCR